MNAIVIYNKNNSERMRKRERENEKEKEKINYLANKSNHNNRTTQDAQIHSECVRTTTARCLLWKEKKMQTVRGCGFVGWVGWSFIHPTISPSLPPTFPLFRLITALIIV